MRGSRRVRRWLHDGRYSVRDGYLFDLRDRYLRRFKITAVGNQQAREIWQTLTRRISERWRVEGRTFFNTPNDWAYSRVALIDGAWSQLGDGPALLAELADALDDTE